MTEGKAKKLSKGFNAQTRHRPNVSFDVVGSGENCYVRQINTNPVTGENQYGVAAY